MLYQLAETNPDVFNDIKRGNNGDEPCCEGFTAQDGWEFALYFHYIYGLSPPFSLLVLLLLLSISILSLLILLLSLLILLILLLIYFLLSLFNFNFTLLFLIF